MNSLLDISSDIVYAIFNDFANIKIKYLCIIFICLPCFVSFMSLMISKDENLYKNCFKNLNEKYNQKKN